MAPNIEFNTNTLTTNGGTPVANNRFTLRAGPRGTLLAVTWLFSLQAVSCLPSCSEVANFADLRVCAAGPALLQDYGAHGGLHVQACL
jgi:hypothetical protein